LGNDAGARLAWGEGFATYFGLTAVKSGNLKTAVPGLPTDDYDTWYGDYRGDNTSGIARDYHELDFSTNAEYPSTLLGGKHSKGRDGGFFTDIRRRGEGDEYSVLLSMWDYYDSENEVFDNTTEYHSKTRQFTRDRIAYGDRDAWTRLITPSGPKRFSGYWANLTADAGTATGRGKITGLATQRQDEAVAALGETLEAAGIAAVPLNLDNGATVRSVRPTFRFLEQNESNSDWYRILVFSHDWSTLVFSSALIEDKTSEIRQYNYDPTADLPNGSYWWVVLNAAAGAAKTAIEDVGDRYKMYWSGARQFKVMIPAIPEPASGLLAMLAVGWFAVIFRRERPCG
jgi:hypothetical protein